MKRIDTLRRGLNHRSSKEITGANYRASCGACTVPPWGVCACSSAELLALNSRVLPAVRVEPTQSDRFVDRINDEAQNRLQHVLA